MIHIKNTGFVYLGGALQLSNIIPISLWSLIFFAGPISVSAYQEGTYHCDRPAARVSDVPLTIIDVAGIKMPYIEYTDRSQYSTTSGKGIASVVVNTAGATTYESIRLPTAPAIILAWLDGMLTDGCKKIK